MLINDVYSILACCGSLIVIDEEELIVHFIHHSVKQFLLHIYTDSSTGEFTMKSCNRHMADVIVTYLNYGIFDTRLSTKVVPLMPVRSAPSTIICSALDSSTTVRGLALKLLKSRRQPDFDIGKTLAEASNLVKTPSVDNFHFYAYAKSYWFQHISSSPRRECYELLREVLNDGIVDANATNNDGMTPLAYAIDDGNLDIVKVLLDMNKINVNLPDTKYGRTPLMWAARRGNQTVVKLLLETGNADPNLKNLRYGWTPLIYATCHGHEAVVELLLENDDVNPDLEDTRDGRTALSWAAAHGQDAVVKLLLETGQIDVNSRPTSFFWLLDDDRTPLSFAAQYGNNSVVKLLLETSNVNPDSADSQQRTPLSWAAQHGNHSVVKLLLETSKVNPDSKDSQKRTPLMWASLNDHHTVVKLLLETDMVDSESTDINGMSARSLALRNGPGAVSEALQLYFIKDLSHCDGRARRAKNHCIGRGEGTPSPSYIV
jgi:ankyrin repeat protein